MASTRTGNNPAAALKVSSNRAAAQLLQQVGLDPALYYAQRLGIASHLPMVPSLALGTGEVTLLDSAAYSAFANMGSLATPRLITASKTRRPRHLVPPTSITPQAISPRRPI